MCSKYTYTRKDGKKIRLHRLVMQEHLGRELLPNEHIYHVDGNSHNNDIKNLIIIKKKENP